MKTAIANSIESLFDLLSSDICEGQAIHCTFRYPLSKSDMREIERLVVKRKVKTLRVNDVVFECGVNQC